MTKQKRKIIMDCDPGHDDAMAIILAAASPELEILGISTVSGNAEIEKTTLNAIRICDLVSLKDIPISKGASNPLVRFRESAPSIHGDSGLDGPAFPKTTRKWNEEHGSDLIIRLVKESKDPVTVTATGPLTNIALALAKAPEIKSNIAEIIIMGGGTFGNWTPTAEFNIWADPEAAKKVFESDMKLTVMGLDITHQALATEKVLGEMRELGNNAADTLVDLLVFFTKTYKDTFNFDSPPVHDVLTIAYLVAPELFTMKNVNIAIETRGEYTKGTTAVDLHGKTGRGSNALYGMKLDIEGFWKLMIKALRTY